MANTYPSFMNEVASCESGLRMCAGFFVTGAAHGTPALTCTTKGVTVEAVAGADGVYKITLLDDNVKKIYSAKVDLNYGVSSESVEDLTSAEQLYQAKGCYTDLNVESNCVFYIRMSDLATGTIQHLVGKHIDFVCVYGV